MKGLNRINKIRFNGNVKSVIVIFLIFGIVIGSYFGLQLALNNSIPFRVVESGSMCVIYDGPCDGLSHPFAPTLHKGDIIVIQRINPVDLKTNYPNSDIIVYKNPNDPTGTPIVHRIVAVQKINSSLFFQTKGDGNPSAKFPDITSDGDWDSHTIWHTGQGVTEDAIEGKVVMRIPLFGWITLLMRQNSLVLPLIIGIILLLVVVEFVVPIIKDKRKLSQSRHRFCLRGFLIKLQLLIKNYLF
jgi:signal peptidase I